MKCFPIFLKKKSVIVKYTPQYTLALLILSHQKVYGLKNLLLCVTYVFCRLKCNFQVSHCTVEKISLENIKELITTNLQIDISIVELGRILKHALPNAIKRKLTNPESKKREWLYINLIRKN